MSTAIMTPPEKHLTGRCEVCSTEYESSVRPRSEEDYSVETKPCPACHKDLCRECKAHGKAFVCSNCGGTFCAEHRTAVWDEDLCPGCAEQAVPALAAMREKLAGYKRACDFIVEITDCPPTYFGVAWDASYPRAVGVAHSIAVMAPLSERSIEAQRKQFKARTVA